MTKKSVIEIGVIFYKSKCGEIDKGRHGKKQ